MREAAVIPAGTWVCGTAPQIQTDWGLPDLSSRGVWLLFGQVVSGVSGVHPPNEIPWVFVRWMWAVALTVKRGHAQIDLSSLCALPKRVRDMRCASSTWALSVLPDRPPPNNPSQNREFVERWAFVQEGIRVLEARSHLHDSHNGQHK